MKRILVLMILGLALGLVLLVPQVSLAIGECYQDDGTCRCLGTVCTDYFRQCRPQGRCEVAEGTYECWCNCDVK